MKVEKKEIWITCKKALQFSDKRAVRGVEGLNIEYSDL